MKVIVYADFNCPYCYLASQRADLLVRLGTGQVDWRAVEHNRGLPLTGSRAAAEEQNSNAALVDVAGLALPGESAPDVPPAVISNTGAAVAAYAEAVSDGVEDELRRRLFRAIWADGRHISSASEVKRVVREIMAPRVPVVAHLRSPDLPLPIIQDPDLARIVRRSGGTIAADGVPLTTTGWERIRQWRREWQSLPEQGLPVVVSAGDIHSGTRALSYLASIVQAAARAGQAGGSSPWRVGVG
jgi:hypothetical protein